MKKVRFVAIVAALAIGLTAGLASCAASLGDESAINNYVPTVLTFTTETGGVLTFAEIEGNAVKVVSYTGKKLTDDVVKIPATIEDKPVTVIGEKAFYGLSSVSEVELPDSVLKVEPYAFAGCTALASIVLPAQVAEVSDYAFQGCTSLKTADLGDTASRVGQYAFWGCTALESVEFSDSLKVIDTAAFWNCSALKTLDTKMVETIGTFAFYNCTGLETILLRDALKQIGEFEQEGSRLAESVFVTAVHTEEDETGDQSKEDEDPLATLLAKIDETAYSKNSVAYRYVEIMIKGNTIEETPDDTAEEVPADTIDVELGELSTENVGEFDDFED